MTMDNAANAMWYHCLYDTCLKQCMYFNMIYSMTISLHGRRISLDCIEFSNMLLATTAAVLLRYYYSSRGNCTPGYRGGTAL
jgi:hypothetical protein